MDISKLPDADATVEAVLYGKNISGEPWARVRVTCREFLTVPLVFHRHGYSVGSARPTALRLWNDEHALLYCATFDRDYLLLPGDSIRVDPPAFT